MTDVYIAGLGTYTFFAVLDYQYRMLQKSSVIMHITKYIRIPVLYNTSYKYHIFNTEILLCNFAKEMVIQHFEW